jgi:hypothetical protein
MSQTTSSETVNRLASRNIEEKVIETPFGRAHSIHHRAIVLSLILGVSLLLSFYNHLVITSTKAQKMQQKTRMEHHISINKIELGKRCSPPNAMRNNNILRASEIKERLAGRRAEA